MGIIDINSNRDILPDDIKSVYCWQIFISNINSIPFSFKLLVSFFFVDVRTFTWERLHGNNR